ncbi:MAG: hypothetical protein ACOYLO_05805 [Ferruginibacter sp.]
MNKIFFAVSCILSATLFSCSKNDGPAPVETYKYLTLTSGSSWMYEITNNNAPGGTSTNTMVSTNRDSVIYNRSYHVFTNSLDNSSEYYAIEGKEYYNFILLPIGANQTRRINLYFAADQPVNTSWTQNYPISLYPSGPSVPTITLVVVSTIKEKGLTKTVNSKPYNNVVYVETVFTSPDIVSGGLVTLSGNIKSYYAPNYGLIEESRVINVTLPPPAVGTSINTTKILKTATLL